MTPEEERLRAELKIAVASANEFASQVKAIHPFKVQYEKIVEQIRAMDLQAERLTKREQTTFRDGEDQAPRDEDFDDVVIGYKFNTGCWHRILGLIAGFGSTCAQTEELSKPEREPDGYAVLLEDKVSSKWGFWFVGIWNTKESADLILSKSKAHEKVSLAPMFFQRKLAPQGRDGRTGQAADETPAGAGPACAVSPQRRRSLADREQPCTCTGSCRGPDGLGEGWICSLRLPPAHNLYREGDPGAPDSIKDRNGEIVLGLCKRCGKGEAELSEPCVSREQLPQHGEGQK